MSSPAQLNPAGYWNPIFHEDVDERIPGPPIGGKIGKYYKTHHRR